MAVTKIQLMRMAQQLKRQGTRQEAEQLQQLAETGLSEEQQEQLSAVMQDKEQLGRLLASPQAQACPSSVSTWRRPW